jgi:hypothetical protein
MLPGRNVGSRLPSQVVDIQEAAITRDTPFVTLVDSAAMWDLRLLGVSRSIPVAALGRHLLPWARAGLLLAAPTGVLLFMTDATQIAANPAFRLKLTLIAAAILNAEALRRWTYRSI